MIYFETTADASDLYRSNSASEEYNLSGTAVPGNLADLIKTKFFVRTSSITPTIVRKEKTDAHSNIMVIE